MSHFSVLVTLPEYSEDALNAALQPFHEFECTGVDDQYVKDIDDTDELRKRYQEKVQNKMKGPDGEIVNPWEDRFYRPWTAEELETRGGVAPMGSGFGGGVIWSSKDWGDGKGYSSRVRFVPEGWEEIELPAKDIQSFRDFVTYETERTEILPPTTERDPSDEETKYGYTIIDANGEVLKTCDRTNPNRKWDWFQVGGRYAGAFKPKPGAVGVPGDRSWMNKDTNLKGKVDVIRKGDVDWDAAEAEAKSTADKYWGHLTAVFDATELEELKQMKTWMECVKAVEAEHGRFDRDKCRAMMDSDPFRVKFKDLLDAISETYFKGWWDSLDDVYVGYDYDRLLAQQVYYNIATYAILHEGEWKAKGDMGWFGCDSNVQEDWATKSVEFVRGLPDDTVLVNVDCHI